MQSLSLSAYSRCRHLIFKPGHPGLWLNEPTWLISRRHRNSSSCKRVKKVSGVRENNKQLLYTSRNGSSRWNPMPPPYKVPNTQIDPNNIPAFFESDVVRWSEFRHLPSRLESFGIPKEDVPPLLRKFVAAIQSGELSTPEAFDKYGLNRFGQVLSPTKYLAELDIIYTTILYAWASDPANQHTLEQIIPLSTILTIQRLAQAADRYYPAEEYTAARKMHRKVIMHVGPTNSGKTHHALRALAAAKSGVYASPLRLLAHEIWERLNLGQIIPLGMEEEAASAHKSDTDSARDIPEAVHTAWKGRNPKYSRMCNMLTGEEQKIVSETAPLLSCTVEMLAVTRKYDVAVIDEIQMIADEQRGSGWTHAVLGICAKELHLCGEETAVPLIQALLKDTGDELIIKRYGRLTPLVVEKESLNGDFSLVRKGDCIVTFRRTRIFAIKRQIEEATGMRSAVVYGKLPPEIRSEQAALFNDPQSNYDVLIGSDAIGMGLNLKIRRIIFEAVRKWDGGNDRLLSVSQIKQIAGRAGRFGLHGDEKPGGFATTLHEPDLSFLRNSLDIPFEPLQFARLGPNKETFSAIANAMPPGASTETIYNAHIFVSRLQPIYRYAQHGELLLKTLCEFIDSRGKDLTISDRVTLMTAPVPWRDEPSLDVVGKFIWMYKNRMNVNLMEGLRGTKYMEMMLRVEKKMTAGVPPNATTGTLEVLEGFHKLLVLYLWMSFRNPVAYNKHDEAAKLKLRLESALDWALEGVSTSFDTESSWNNRTLRSQRPIAYRGRRDLQANLHYNRHPSYG